MLGARVAVAEHSRAARRSAALFDAGGQMVAQAAHIPVHFGAMPEAVRAVRERSPHAGDVFILNDPYAGGSHLPDTSRWWRPSSWVAKSLDTPPCVRTMRMWVG